MRSTGGATQGSTRYATHVQYVIVFPSIEQDSRTNRNALHFFAKSINFTMRFVALIAAFLFTGSYGFVAMPSTRQVSNCQTGWGVLVPL